MMVTLHRPKVQSLVCFHYTNRLSMPGLGSHSMPGLALFLPAAGFWVFSAIVEPIFLQHMRPEDVERTSREKEKMT